MLDLSVNAQIKVDLNDIPKEKWDDIAKQIKEIHYVYGFEYDNDGYIEFETDISIKSYTTFCEEGCYDGWENGEYKAYGNFTEVFVEDLTFYTPEDDILEIDKDAIVEIDYDEEYVTNRIKEYEMEMEV